MAGYFPTPVTGGFEMVSGRRCRIYFVLLVDSNSTLVCFVESR
jgi:hypothetical protein